MLSHSLILLFALITISTCFIESVSLILKRGGLLNLMIKIYAADQWLRLAAETVWGLRSRYAECIQMARLGKDRNGIEI